jgi:hypothetical protein
MTAASYSFALALSVLFSSSSVFSAEDSVFKEAQDAILATLDMPLGNSGKDSIHIRFQRSGESKGERATCEFWNPKLHLRLSEGAELSVADKLNGKTQALWQGEAMLSADAFRLLLNPDAITGSELQYKRWETPHSTFGPNGFFGFSVIKTAEGWKVKMASRGATGGKPPYDKVIALSLVPPAKPNSTCSENELKTAFNELIHSQSAENLVLVERNVASFSSYINADMYHEFHTPTLEFAMLPLTDAQALNGDVMASVRVNCEAHKFTKTVKSRTAQTPADLPEEIPMWKGKKPEKEWEPGPSNSEKGACDYVGIRKSGKWTFTISAFLMNSTWLEKVVLLPKSESPKPEDILPEIRIPVTRPQSGIGAALALKGTVVEITSLTAGGPAEKSGQLKVGDRIVAIADDDPPIIWGRIDIVESDNKDYRDLQFSEVIKQIRGEAGKAVYLRVQPVGTNDPSRLKEVKIIRAVLNPK